MFLHIVFLLVSTRTLCPSIHPPHVPQQHEKSKYYVKPRMATPIFSINHFAGEVTYVIDGFLEKNKDQLNDDLVQVYESSG